MTNYPYDPNAQDPNNPQQQPDPYGQQPPGSPYGNPGQNQQFPTMPPPYNNPQQGYPQTPQANPYQQNPYQGQPDPNVPGGGSYYAPPQPNAANYGYGQNPQSGSSGASLWGKRIVAIILDALILIIPNYIVYAILAGLFLSNNNSVTYSSTNHGFTVSSNSGFYAAAFIIYLIVIALDCLYFGFLDSSTQGTIGKRVMKIRVIKSGTNQQPSFQTCYLRMAMMYGLFAFGSFPFFLLKIIALAGIVDILMPLWANGGLALHDSVTKTQIVYYGP